MAIMSQMDKASTHARAGEGIEPSKVSIARAKTSDGRQALHKVPLEQAHTDHPSYSPLTLSVCKFEGRYRLLARCTPVSLHATGLDRLV